MANEIFALLGRIRLDGMQETVSGVEQVGSRFETLARRAGAMGQAIGKAGKAVSDAGAKMTANVTAPLAALGTAAVMTANDTDKATGRIQAQLGLTEDQAYSLSKSAQRVWANGFGENVGEAADAIALVGQNMRGLSERDMEAATKNAMTFSEAFGEDVTASTSAASVLMKNFGVDGQRAFDIMTVGMQKGGNYSGELLDTLREYAPQFAGMGMNADEMMNVLINGADAGAFNLDKVGDAVKEFNIRAQDGSKTTAAGFDAIGMDAKAMGEKIAAGGDTAKGAYDATIAALAGMKDPMERNAAGVALFGSQWEDLESGVITSMTTTGNALGNVEGATKKAGDAMADNFGSRATVAMRQLGIALEPLGRILMDMAEKFIPVFQQKIQQLSLWFASLTGTQQKWIVILGLAAAAAGPLLLVLGTLMGSIGNIISVASKMGGAFKLLIGGAKLLGVALRFLSMNPIGLIITAITAAVAIGIYLYKNWDSIRPKLIKIWENVKDGLANAWQAAKDKMAAIVGAMRDWLVNTWTSIKNKIVGFGANIRDGLANAWQSAKDKTAAIVGAMRDWVVNTWTSFKNRIVDGAGKIRDGIAGAFNSAKTKAQAIFGAIRDWIINTWTKFKNRVIDGAGDIRDGIRNAFQAAKDKTLSIFGAMRDWVQRTWSSLKNKVVGFAGNLRDGITGAFSTARTKTQNTWAALRDYMAGLWLKLKNKVTGFAGNIRDGVVKAFTTARDKATGIFSTIKKNITEKFEAIKTEAGKIPGKIGSAITEKVKKATDSMKDLAKSLIKKFKEALGINSPSRVFFEMAGHIISGLSNGLSAGNLKNLGKNVFSDFAGGALKSLDAIKGFMSGGFSGAMGRGAKKAAGWIRQAMAITGVSDSWFGPLMNVAKKESGFNPSAINLWDSNARAGHPSQGLFQTIPTTFAANRIPGMNDITNPIDNAVAAIRYMQDRYGSVFNLPGIQSMAGGGGYKGYYKGGVFTGPSVIQVAENSKTPVEAAIPLSGRYMWPFADAIGSRIAANGGPQAAEREPLRITIEAPVFLNGREMARAIAPDIDVELATEKARTARAAGRIK